jgi:hypothetical protein
VTTIAYSGQLVTTTCWCGSAPASPEELYSYMERQHRDGHAQNGIYCPLGHVWSFAGEGEAAKLARRLEQEATRRARAVADRDQAEASARAYKGVATRAKKRAAAATCPCCKRSFVQLRRHLATKHPDYTGAVE